MSACSDDDNSDPKLSFGRSIYILKAAEPLAVELMVSEPVTEEVRVPFSIDGTAVLDLGDPEGKRDRTTGDSFEFTGSSKLSFME